MPIFSNKFPGLAKQFPYLLLLVGGVIILDLLPVFHAVFIEKAPLDKLPLVLGHVYYGAGGGGYYSAWLREIRDGYPFFGNPYFFEHRNELSPAFFGAAWLAFIPMLFGLPLNTTLIFNAFFWSILFVLLAYFLCRKLQLSSLISVAAALITFSQVYFLMRAPITTQNVFPFFLVFYLAYLNWFSNPNSRKAMLALVLAIAIPFYIYTFLWQIVAVTSLTAIIFLLARREIQLVRRFLLIGGIAFFLALPMGWYIFQQISSPFYQDMIQRFGIISTRLPTLLAFFSGAWVVNAVLLWFFSSRWLKEFQANQQFRSAFSFFVITGLALLGVSFSNVITGKDMELPIHIERFMVIWASLSLTSFIYFLFKNKSAVWQIAFWRKAILGMFIAIAISGLFYYWKYWPNFSFGEIRENLIAVQKPAQWLEDNEKEPVVILTGLFSSAGVDIPVFTKHYVLFASNGSLHLVSSREVEDRYLIANYFFYPLTLQKIEEDFAASVYSGLGNAVHQYKTYNRKVKLCRLFQLPRFGVSCGELQTAISFRGKPYFENLYRRYADEISPRILEKLREYHVKYILLDMTRDNKEYFKNQLHSSGITARLAYEDEYYLLYEI